MCLALKETEALLFSVRPFHLKADFLGLLLFRPRLVLPRRLLRVSRSLRIRSAAFLLEALGFCSGIQRLARPVFVDAWIRPNTAWR